MVWLGNSELVNAVVAIERARSDMGRRHVDPKLWDVEVAVDEAVPQLNHKGRMFLRITPTGVER